MSISGNLKTMELAELLQWLSQSQKTGTLIFHNLRVEKRIVFEAGRITSTASTDPNEYLGHFLVGHGFITELELAQAMEMQDSNRMLLGKILVTIGAISEEELDRILRLKAEESLYDIFNWSEGEFRFQDDDLPQNTMMPMSLDVTMVVMEGTHRVDEWRRIREAIPSDDAIVVSVIDLLADPELDAGERNVLGQVNDDNTIEEICLQSHASNYFVSRALFRQLQLGHIKLIRPRWRKAEPEQASDLSALVDAKSVVKQAQKHFQKREFTQSLRNLAAARSLEPENVHVRQIVEKAEAMIQVEIEKEGLVPTAVPQLACAPEDLTSLDLTPQEGFIVSRIDGSYDIHSICKISPISDLEALTVFWRLHRAGHIELRG